jgi:hypothetical protein
VGKTVPIVAATTIVVLLSAALVLGSGPSGTGACAGTTAAAPTAAAHKPVDGYAGDQLANAAAIINAGAALRVPSAGITIGVMVAMGESGLRNLTYGDSAGPDSRGLFQQRDNWGTLADRLNPSTAAAAFFRRLLTVQGWQSMAPTLAAHAVQGNAVAGYYTPFWAAATAVVTALTGGSTACAADLVPSANTRALAQQLQTGIKAGTITGLVPDHLREITWIAEGRTVPNCGVDPRILQVITIAWKLYGRIGISDINRKCTGQIAGAGTDSSHWIHGGGDAVDLYSLAGTPTTGADGNAIRLITTLDPLMPTGARIGQAECRTADGDSPHLTHLTTFDDTCNHLHIDVAFTTGALAGPAGATTSTAAP